MKLQEYQPRDVFLPLHNRSKRWTTVVAHRRAGKTVAMCADLVIGALETARPRPQFAYLAPFREQAKRVAWQYLKELTKDFQASPPNESELRIDIQNGHKDISRIYVAGADNPDALRGMYFDGVVLDETGQIRPSAWYSVLRPALSDRKGWAIFAGTPAGKNFFWQIREEARLNPDTHLLLELPASKTGILDAEELRDAQAQMTPEAYATEYEISFDAAIPGAYYAKLIGAAYDEGRVSKYPIDVAFPVNLAADLGYTDSCSWWGWQETPDGYRIVDFYEADGQPIQHYIDWIKQRPYRVGTVFLPHDAKAKSLQTGKSIIEQFLTNGIRPQITTELSLQDGIEAARLILPKCYFDEDATYEGVEHLRAYMREWDEKTQTFRNKPKHDQHSHCFVAGTMVSTPTGQVEIESIKVGDVVKTPRGHQSVDAVMSREVDELLELEFSNGAKIVCTKDHPFYTTSGIVLADALRYSHQLVPDSSCKQSISFKSLMVSGSTRSQMATTNRTGSSTAVSTCTAMFGSGISGRFQKGITSITRTVTSSTTRLKTWRSSLAQSIQSITTANGQKVGGQMAWKRQDKQQSLGTLLKLANAGTNSTVLLHGSEGQWAHINAHTAQRLTKSWLAPSSVKETVSAATTASQLSGALAARITRLVVAAFAPVSSFVIGTARKKPAVRLVHARPLAKRARVYDLTVRHEHAFYAEGLLVSNCADAFRYLALSVRPLVAKRQHVAKMAPNAPEGAHYAFTMDQLWDTAVRPSQRIG